MELFKRTERAQLVAHLAGMHDETDGWRLADVTLSHEEGAALTVDSVGQLLMAVFAGYEGLVALQSQREVRLLIRWPVNESPHTLMERMRQRLPVAACAIHVHPAATDAVAHLYQQLKQTQEAKPMQPHRVLIADDDLYMRTLVKKGLGDGFTIYEVTDGQAVLHAYAQYKPDIVFLDIHLPGRQGPDILSEIIAIDAHAYIIMLSADSSEENVRNTIKLGAKSFLTKPFTKDKLLTQVYRCPRLQREAPE